MLAARRVPSTLADGSICSVYQVLDDRSRLLVASHVTAGETAQGAITVIDKAIAAYQVPQLLLTDNGSAFNPTRGGRAGQLVAHVQALGCRAITGRPGHPQTQGKDERVHQTTQRWLAARPRPDTEAGLLRLLEDFDQQYNNTRPHQSLRMRTPAQVVAEEQRAVPPTPPEPATPGTAPPVRAGFRRVGLNGKICVRYVAIQLGYEHRSTTVTVVLNGDHVTILIPAER